MSTAVVSGFSSSKVHQENRLKSRKQSRQSGLKPLSKQTEGEYRGSSKRYTSTPLVTPRKALGELSNNVKATPLHSDTKRKGRAVINVVPPSSTKRQGTSVPRKTNEVEKPSKTVSEFPDAEFQPNTISTSDVDSPLVTPFYFKELSLALNHTTYMPPTLQDPPQPPVPSLTVPRRPMSTHPESMTKPDVDIGTATGSGDVSLLDLPDLPDFDF